MSIESIDIRRKRLTFRSWHRGTREMDLLLGSFADRHMASFEADDLEAYERILEINDPDLYNWISGQEAAPANLRGGVMDLLLAHRFK